MNGEEVCPRFIRKYDGLAIDLPFVYYLVKTIIINRLNLYYMMLLYFYHPSNFPKNRFFFNDSNM